MPYADYEKTKANAREYGRKNRAEIVARSMAWKAAHPEADAVHDRRYREKNQEKIRAARKAYRESEHGKAVRKASGKRSYENMTEHGRKVRMICTARNNARAKGLEFSLAISDLEWPQLCPVLGIRLNYGAPTNGRNSADSPSLDRRDPSKGYVKGNVFVMSWRANRIKCDATPEEAAMLADYLRKTRSN